jgi:hypothetical protein
MGSALLQGCGEEVQELVSTELAFQTGFLPIDSCLPIGNPLPLAVKLTLVNLVTGLLPR